MYKVYYQFEGPQINQPVIPPPTAGHPMGTTFELLSPFGYTFNMYCNAGESNMYEIAIGKIAGMSAGASLTILTQ